MAKSKGIDYVLRVIDYATAPFKKIIGEGKGVANTFKKIGDEANAMKNRGVSAVNSLKQKLNGVGGQFKGLAIGLAAVFSVATISSFARNVGDVAVKYEKLNAVMNTQNQGNLAKTGSELKMLSEFASEYGVKIDELEGSFVKLKSQGFEPTKSELLQLTNIAQASGKSFDQLAEAILDGQTGEFERLKEFGIKANQHGDKITFTFKGIKTTVDKSEDSIRKYLLGIGDMPGVAGAAAAAADTMEGKMNKNHNTLLSFKRSLGDVFLTILHKVTEIFGKWMKKLEPVGKWLKEHPRFVNGMAIGLAILTGVVGAAAIAVGVATAATWLFNAALWANPVTLVVAGVLALIAVIALVIVYIDELSATWDGLTDYMAAAWGEFKTSFTTTWLEVEQFFMSGINTLKEAWYSFQSLWDEDAAAAGMAQIKAYDAGIKSKIAESKGLEAQYRQQQDDAVNSMINAWKSPAKKAGSQGVLENITKDISAQNAGGKKDKKDASGAAGAGKSKSKGVNEGGSRPTTITIHIGKLQDQLIVQAGTLKEAAKKAGQDVVNEILMALNSVDQKGGAAYE